MVHFRFVQTRPI